MSKLKIFDLYILVPPDGAPLHVYLLPKSSQPSLLHNHSALSHGVQSIRM